MHGLLIASNLGLGDHIICNALVRRYAAHEEFVALPVKYHNLESVAWMFRDLPNVILRPCEDHEDARQFVEQVWRGRKLLLGTFNPVTFQQQIWDQSLYTQAGVQPQMRWSGWKCQRDKVMEIAPANVMQGIEEGQSWCFFHEDRARGLLINRYPELIPPARVRPDHRLSPNIFAWWSVIEQAPIIHCICSSFALFIDSVPLPLKPRLYLHAYARPNEALPQFQKEWTILT